MRFKHPPGPLRKGEVCKTLLKDIGKCKCRFQRWKRGLWYFQTFFFPLQHETYQKLNPHQGTANSAAAVEEKGPDRRCLAQSSGTVPGTAELYE